MDELTEIREYQRIILRYQIAILNIIGVLAKERTGKIPVVYVEIEDIAGKSSIIHIAPSIEDVILCQELSDSSSPKQE
jgi:hypothetical protein